jgi:hypothetical protein
MVNPDHLEGYDPFVRALIQFSAKVPTPKSAETPAQFPGNANPLFDIDALDAPDWDGYETPSLTFEHEDYALPLEPLREKDLTALVDLFNTPNMREIDADVQTRLQSLYPEPCWEDDLFAFLKGYL